MASIPHFNLVFSAAQTFDGVPVDGQVYIRPNLTSVLVANDDAHTTLAPLPIPAKLVAGSLKDMAGNSFVDLPCHSDLLGLTNHLQYVVSFREVTAAGHTVPGFRQVIFDAPIASGEFDLADAIPVVGSPGVGLIRGPAGPPGQGLEISGTAATYAGLPASANVGAVWLVEADQLLYVRSATGWPASGSGIPMRGPKGDTGAQGPAGPQGVQGQAGVSLDIEGSVPNYAALASLTPVNGQAWVNAADGKLYYYDNGFPANGAGVPFQGAQGPTGAQGVQGPKGDTGAQGPAGATGAQGPKGDTGATGAQGPKGDTGATGPAGTTDWNGLANKPSTFPPSAHSHPISDVTGLQAALDAKQPTSLAPVQVTQAAYDALGAGRPARLYAIVG